ncbi:hypothetical protein WJX73_008963 [Symbiochloris irregularis]|uniref:Uncharacterized protein n=1 Tax=Symbiochloris irregularis TaxID=706552 RepID=A0AAW1NRB9_9CHLO
MVSKRKPKKQKVESPVDASASEDRVPRLRTRASDNADSDRSRPPAAPAPAGKRTRRRRASQEGLEASASLLQPAEALPTSPSMSQQDKGPPPLHEGTRRDFQTLMHAVVKVFCMHSEPNWSLPWQRKRQYASSGSGFIIEGRRILTNAHCIEHGTQVKVRRRGSETKFIAQVICVGTECDIAMLSVEDDSFWEGLQPVTFGELPKLQDSVTVIGFPVGGDSMSVTSGVVSRIEVTVYAQSTSELLGVQIDAAINGGNSGGPAFNVSGECVGVAFQTLRGDDAESIGYIIPTPVVHHFISDYERNKRFTAFPNIGIEWQRLESPQLRQALGMKAEHKGVRVRRVDPTVPLAASVREGDILLSFDGIQIGNDGTVPFRSGERLSFTYLVSHKYTHDKATLRLLRDGKEFQVQSELVPNRRLIPYHLHGRVPPYFIIAGLVFTQVTVPFMRSEFGKDFDFDSPISLLERLANGQVTIPGQEVVLLACVLASDVSIGYEEVTNVVVRKLNGKAINNLPELVCLVEGCKDPYLRFDLDHNSVLALETKTARAATPDILAMHCVPCDRSEDLRQGKEHAMTIRMGHTANASALANGT